MEIEFNSQCNIMEKKGEIYCFFSFTFVTVLQSAAVRLRFDTKQKCKTNTEDSADFFQKKFSFFIKTEKFNPEVN